jgi:hypothetical protein
VISSVLQFVDGVFISLLSVLHTLSENVFGPKSLSALNEEYLWAIAGLLFLVYWVA